MKKTSILFIGGIIDDVLIQEVHKNSAYMVQNAINRLQKDIVKGLFTESKHKIDVFYAPFVGSFPYAYKKAVIPGFAINNEYAIGQSITILNLPVIKHLWTMFAATAYLKKWLKRNDENNCVVFIFTLYAPFLYTAKAAIKKSAATCVYVGDIPYAMHKPRSLPFKLCMAATLRTMAKILPFINMFILAAEPMIEKLDVRDRPYVVLEGTAPNVKMSQYPSMAREKILMYTGTLDPIYGIINLVDAFRNTRDPSLRLWICGEGGARKQLEEIAKQDCRIKYYGQIPIEHVQSMQQKAHVLVNPRPNIGEYTKYSFPSKILEYMSSGIPVLMYRLDGIPEAYFEHSYIIKGNSIDDFTLSIEDTLSKSEDELALKGEQARLFVQNRASIQVQCDKILSMFDSYFNDEEGYNQ